MWVTKLVAMALLATAASAATAALADKVLSNHATLLANNSASLAFSLYQNMVKEKDLENILISPVVVASSLGLVALGGKASTASQVKTVLSADKVKDEQLHAGLAELLEEVSNSKTRNVTWKISNRIYSPSSVNFADAFVKSSKKHYHYDHTKINFKDKKSAVKSINDWAAKSTDGKLPEVTKDVERTDGAMIINAMFFKREFDLTKHQHLGDTLLSFALFFIHSHIY
jgi:serpin peptidase inhibitor clade H protein 1